LRQAVRAFDALVAELRLIRIDDDVARTAGDLAERHGLRGYDAVHLASASAIADPGLVLATWDHDLATAASACGYAVPARR
jgi:uncharacterized protein